MYVNQFLLGLSVWVSARLLLAAQWSTQVVYRGKAVSDTLHALFLSDHIINTHVRLRV